MLDSGSYPPPRGPGGGAPAQPWAIAATAVGPRGEGGGGGPPSPKMLFSMIRTASLVVWMRRTPLTITWCVLCFGRLRLKFAMMRVPSAFPKGFASITPQFANPTPWHLPSCLQFP